MPSAWSPWRSASCSSSAAEITPRTTVRAAGRSLSRGRVVAMRKIPIGDLVTGRQPHLVMPGDVLERLVQILVAERLVDDERMERQTHRPTTVRALLIQHVELVHHHLR